MMKGFPHFAAGNHLPSSCASSDF